MSGSPGRRADLLVAAGLIAVVGLLYGQVASHEFVNFDDPGYILENPDVATGLSWENIRWAATQSRMGNWHPLTWVSHMADVELFGTDPTGHHLMSVALHAAVAVLLFAALRRMTGAFWPCAAVALVFAVHPLRVESVAWASERKDVLAALFWMITLIAYTGYARRPSGMRYAVVALAFALGLASKPMVVTLPFVLLLLDVWPLGRWEPRPGNWLPERRLLVEKLPLIALAAGCILLTLGAQSRGRAVTSLESISLAERLVNVPLAYGRYVVDSVYPSGLAFFYPHAGLGSGTPQAGPGGVLGLALGVLAVILALTWLALRRAPDGRLARPYALVGWLWYLGTLVPVIGLIQVGGQAVADRYTYIPTIGLSLAVVWLVASTPIRLRRALVVAGLIVIALWGRVTWHQIGTWQDSVTLNRHALEVTENNIVARTLMGAALAERGDLDGARAELQQVVATEPTYIKGVLNLAGVQLQRGELEDAARLYEQALAIDERRVDAHVGLGTIRARQQRYDEAIDHLERALELRPNDEAARNNLRVVRKRRQRQDG